jgi:hypothetical protein
VDKNNKNIKEMEKIIEKLWAAEYLCREIV